MKIELTNEKTGDILSFSWGIGEDTVSLSSIIEENSCQIRRAYIDWIKALSHSTVEGRSAVEHFSMTDRYSFWWMSNIIETSLYKIPVSDSVKLIAVDYILSENDFNRVKVTGSNSGIASLIYDLCCNRDIDCEICVSGDRRLGLSLAFNKLNLLYYLIRAQASFMKILFLKLCSIPKFDPKLNNSGADLIFVSYFFGKSHAAEDHVFRYWGRLREQLKKMNLLSDWLHIHVSDPETPQRASARKMIAKLDMEDRANGSHSIIQDHLPLKSMGRIFSNWVRLFRQYLSFRKRTLETTNILHKCLMKLHSRDLMKSFVGPHSYYCLFWFEVFSSKFAALKNGNSTLIYLCENQPWEKAMLVAWRRFSSGAAIAIPHATVRFWDFRFYNFIGADSDFGALSLPMPDITAVNGPAMKNSLKQWGYKDEQLVELEALRFGHLENLELSNYRVKSDEKLRILIVGEYLDDVSASLMDCVTKAAQIKSGLEMDIIVKPHPKSPIRVESHPALHFELCGGDIGKALSNCDVAICSHITSASIDAFASGVPVILFNGDGDLNFSPLKGLASVYTVAKPDELIFALKNVQSNLSARSGAISHELFYLDGELPRWKNMLGRFKTKRF